MFSVWNSDKAGNKSSPASASQDKDYRCTVMPANHKTNCYLNINDSEGRLRRKLSALSYGVVVLNANKILLIFKIVVLYQWNLVVFTHLSSLLLNLTYYKIPKLLAVLHKTLIMIFFAVFKSFVRLGIWILIINLNIDYFCFSFLGGKKTTDMGPLAWWPFHQVFHNFFVNLILFFIKVVSFRLFLFFL